MVNATQAEKLRSTYSGPMSADEIELLRDMQGFVEFAIHNGLSLGVVCSVLGHDVNNLARCMFSLEDAKKEGFLPKVAGYGGITEEDVGEPTE